MNSVILHLFLSSLLLATFFAEIPLREKLESLTWKNRVIVIYTPDASSKEFQQQKQILAAKPKELKERDLVVIECVGQTLDAEDKNYLARHFSHDLTKFGVWLVGKDGGTKLTETQPVTAEKFFSLIDSMPMRQAEMRRGTPKN
ncbi:DUF4174 domain-containing protein [Salmonirosea aquatica]|uniref:DUF4174 domain-containing protein n=1 Tax=Salmonirosea aquatica TaxID=2654236 RepID=A0A7C9F2Y1_9BACT|nr:DUF4174 domain-containing protein [Cytophagaceae bacterium SJW1-29]